MRVFGVCAVHLSRAFCFCYPEPFLSSQNLHPSPGSFWGHNFLASPLPCFGNHVQVKSWTKVSPVQFPRYLHVQHDLSVGIFFTLLSLKAHIRPYCKKNCKPIPKLPFRPLPSILSVFGARIDRSTSICPHFDRYGHNTELF